MNIIEYDNQTSLPRFMDQYTKQRLERIIYFESNCTPENTELIEACKVLINHLNGVWDWK